MASRLFPSDIGGLGPLADLAVELHDGSMSLAAAKDAAVRHVESGDVSFEQAVWISDAALRLARSGEWRPALLIGEMDYAATRAAIRAHPEDRSFTEAFAASGANLLDIIHHGVIEAGDIRFFLRANEIAKEAIRGAERLGLSHLQGLVSLRHGALLLDAYTAERSPDGYELQFAAWVARARQSGDPALAELVSRRLLPDGEPDPDHPAATWPEPLDGLAQAERRLREALPLVPERRRAETLKALSQAIEWRAALGGPADEDELRSVTKQALAALGPDDGRRLALIATLRRLGELPEGEEIVRRLEEEWPKFAAEHSPHLAWEMISQAVGLIQDSEPERALRLLTRHRELETIWADEGLRKGHFDTEFFCFARAYAPATVELAKENLTQAVEGLQALYASAATPEGARAAAAGVVAVMTAAAAADQEATALKHVGTLSALASLDHSLWAEREEALGYLVASLYRNEGVNRMRANDFDGAASSYQRAADGFLSVDISTSTVECVEYLDDAVTAGVTELNEITVWLASISLDLELAAPSAAPAAVQQLAGDLLAAQLAAGAIAPVVQLLLDVAKGRRFGAMLAEGTRHFALDEYTRRMLEHEAEVEAALPVDSELLAPTSFDAGDEDLITAWVDEYEEGPEETLAERAGAAQRAIERHLSAALVPSQVPYLADLNQIRGRLGERTALLQIFEGPSSDGGLAIYQVLVAREFEHATAYLERLPYGAVGASWRGHSVMMPLTGFFVGDLRRAIQANPDPLDLTPHAAAQLEGAVERYARVIDLCREQIESAGIDRLVISPHGSNRFLPLHLIGPPGEPLADRFTVSYLTNIAQLTRRSSAPAGAREGIGAFGLSYADQPRLPRLDDSAAEAEAIAAECGTTATLDDAATETAFKRALESRRYIHLRAHGKLFANAPSFHTVFLHPEGSQDGRLRAFEVLPLDLSGLELVTLSACETALGRVDRSDNPRGLPAALLLAGARAVIGTLWPVLATASTFFFTRLYRALVANDGDVVSAFASAQAATKENFSQYRDWGAFYLTGGLGDGGAT